MEEHIFFELDVAEGRAQVSLPQIFPAFLSNHLTVSRAMLLRLYNDNSELVDHSKNMAKRSNDESRAEVVDEDGGVPVDTEMEVDAKEATAGADPEEDAIMAEDRADAAKQDEKDSTRETAEGDVVAPEDDVLNTTV